MGGAVSSGRSNEDLIWKLKKAGFIETVTGEILMKLIDRQFYIITDEITSYYRDTAWQQDDLHMSAPCIYAEVFEKLDLQKGQSFLNFGSGTGYLSTLVGLVLGSMGTNHGVELKRKPFEYSIERLETFMAHHKVLQIMDFARPIFFQGNALSVQSTIKYDRIYCGASIEESDIPYFCAFLKKGGVLIFPQYDKDQLIRLKKDTEGKITYEPQLSVSFASMVKLNPFTNPIMLPGHQPHSLVYLCRRKVLSCVRAHLVTDSYDFCKNMTSPPRDGDVPATSTFKRDENRVLVPPDFFYNTYVLDFPYSQCKPPEPLAKPSSQETETFEATISEITYSSSDEENELEEFCSEPEPEDTVMDLPCDEYNCQAVRASNCPKYRFLRSGYTEKNLISYAEVIETAIETLPLPLSLKSYIRFNQS